MCEHFPDEILVFLFKISDNKITLKFWFIVILDLIFSILLLKTGPSKSDQVSQACVQLNSECLLRQRFHSLSGKPVLVLTALIFVGFVCWLVYLFIIITLLLHTSEKTVDLFSL